VADGRERLFARPDAPHRVHDLLLVTAFAAGDVTPTERLQGEALIAACPACAALVADVRAIERAMAALPADPRPRDFRLTPADAQRLRPHTLRGRFRVIARPRLERAYPIATGLTALGIAGLLVASLSFGPGGAVSMPGGAGAGDTRAAPMQLEATDAGATAPAENDVTGAGPAGTPGSSVAAQAPAPTPLAATVAPVARADDLPADGTTTPGVEPRLVIAVLSGLAAVSGLALFVAARRERRRSG
jgi:hypothetical protein